MPAASEIQQRLADKFAMALGADVAGLLADESVTDVMINSSGKVFVERAGQPIAPTLLSMSAAQRTALVRTAAEVCGGTYTREDWPILEMRVPVTGWRFTGVLSPVAPSTTIAIRTPARRVYSLTSYVESGQLSAAGQRALVTAADEKKNVLVVGGTGTGKTTFATAFCQQIADSCPHDRPVVVEDTPELQCPSANVEYLRTWQDVSMATLLRVALRLNPDRLVVGEVRGKEALILLEGWNTGHPGGVCTVHADSARLGLRRLEQMCREGGDSVRSDIAQAVNLVVFLAKRSVVNELGERCHKRRVEEVLWVRGLDKNGEYECEHVEG